MFWVPGSGFFLGPCYILPPLLHENWAVGFCIILLQTDKQTNKPHWKHNLLGANNWTQWGLVVVLPQNAFFEYGDKEVFLYHCSPILRISCVCSVADMWPFSQGLMWCCVESSGVSSQALAASWRTLSVCCLQRVLSAKQHGQHCHPLRLEASDVLHMRLNGCHC